MADQGDELAVATGIMMAFQRAADYILAAERVLDDAIDRSKLTIHARWLQEAFHTQALLEQAAQHALHLARWVTVTGISEREAGEGDVDVRDVRGQGASGPVMQSEDA